MKIPITVVIPTCERSPLLGRTLESIRTDGLPPEIDSILIIENGSKLGAEAIVHTFADALPVRYLFSPIANKSSALNYGLETIGDHLLIFFDDDIRVGPKTLHAYSSLLASQPAPFFAGGRCHVDYESPPPDWLKRYLPPSAVGWTLGEQLCPLELPQALGFNWCALSRMIKDAGGFNPDRGPGTRSRGQETDMQAKLLARGYKGFFVPEAEVWHYVPKERCSEEWALNRARQTAFYSGTELHKRGYIARQYHILKSMIRVGSARFRQPFAQNDQSRFKARYQIQWNRGILDGALTLGNGPAKKGQ